VAVNHVEFALSKTVVTGPGDAFDQLITLSRRIGADRPRVARGEVDWDLWNEEAMLFVPTARNHSPTRTRTCRYRLWMPKPGIGRAPRGR
jgi:hypothetical protein